jgi:hypothetical protein
MSNPEKENTITDAPKRTGNAVFADGFIRGGITVAAIAILVFVAPRDLSWLWRMVLLVATVLFINIATLKITRALDQGWRKRKI